MCAADVASVGNSPLLEGNRGCTPSQLESKDCDTAADKCTAALPGQNRLQAMVSFPDLQEQEAHVEEHAFLLRDSASKPGRPWYWDGQVCPYLTCSCLASSYTSSARKTVVSIVDPK